MTNKLFDMNEVQVLWDLLGDTGVVSGGDFHVLDVTEEEDIEEQQTLRIYHKDGWCVEIIGKYAEDDITDIEDDDADYDEDDVMFNDDAEWPLPTEYEFKCIWSPAGGIHLSYVTNLIRDYIKNKNADIDDLINKTLNL